MDVHVYPAVPTYYSQLSEGRWEPPAILLELKARARAKAEGLWKLFMCPSEHDEGEIRSAYAMTEPNVASSDATNMQTEIRREGDEYVINGRKWWSSGFKDLRCKVTIVMGRSDLDAPRHQMASQVTVPMDMPGITIGRNMTNFGYDGAPQGHCDVTFDNVRVPASNMILGAGRGFEISQGRLGAATDPSLHAHPRHG